MSEDILPGPVKPSTTLYLVRHGETEYNRRGIMQGGGIDSSLNETGRADLLNCTAHLPADPAPAST